MNKSTLKITTGAMFIAIFAMLLVINQQTGFVFEELVMYILPIPMVAFSAKYGLKSGLPVMAGMILISVLFGTPTTVFYAATESFIGLVLGTCLYKKVDANKTILLVVLLSAIANLLNTVVLASIFGYDLMGEVMEIQKVYAMYMKQMSMDVPEEVLNNFMNPQFLLRMIVISMTLMGMVQGYIVYVISILVLKRLRFHVEKPKSIYTFYPPKILGVIMGGLVFSYAYVNVKPMQSEMLQIVIQTAGICSMMFLMFFGYLAVVLMSRVFFHKKAPGVIIGLVMVFIMPSFLFMAGIIYVVTDYHKRVCEQLDGPPPTDEIKREYQFTPIPQMEDREEDYAEDHVKDVEDMTDEENDEKEENAEVSQVSRLEGEIVDE